MSDQDGAAEREERAIIAAELSRVASLRIAVARGMPDALSLDEERPVNRGLRYRPKRFRVNVGSATAVLEGSAEDIEGLVRAALDAEGGG